ncbi:MAG: hypothetical protein ABIH72_02930 [archaeon]
MGILEERTKVLADIEQAQKELRIVNPESPLLQLVTTTSQGMDYTEEFGAKYEGLTVKEGLRKYLEDLKKETVA